MKSILLIFLLSIFCSASFSQIDLDNGLVAYYPFNGNANDASGNGNNAVFNNATLTSDRLGVPNSAYYFNGVDNYIRIPNSPSIIPRIKSHYAFLLSQWGSTVVGAMEILF